MQMDRFHCFLFDFDGLLVNTEALHYQAYKELCLRHGFALDVSFLEYYTIAGKDAEGPKRMVYSHFPELFALEPDWSVLYKEKKEIFLEILEKAPVDMFPGVSEFLSILEKRGVTRVGVTHSTRQMVHTIIKKQPVLQTIPFWITREDYDKPKPAPDGYIKALQLYKHEDEAAIGFEDSERGLTALMATEAFPVLVNGIDAALVDAWKKQGVATAHSFVELL
jgi:beta-phosphoglucomutase